MPSKKIRYAVVGLGHIAQVAVLPAFDHAKRNSELTAFVSGDAQKLRALGRMYDVANRHSYEEYEALLHSGDIDAVYITLPNSLHHEYAIKAAKAGIHVLCEKPLAVTSKECKEMIAAAEKNDVRLMVAYRLHFEKANMKAVKIIESGKIGDPRIFSSVFSFSVKEGDIRLNRKLGGGALGDIGVYCINATRYLFQDEPIRVSAVAASRDDPRFADVDEMISATLTFPGDRLASFVISFGAASTGEYRVIGTKGTLLAEPGYGYAVDLRHRLTVNGKTTETTFEKRDQFAPMLIHFSDSILKRTDPEPNGTEGLIDVMIIEAIEKSMKAGGKPVELNLPRKTTRPGLDQVLDRPAVKKPKTIRVSSPKT